MDQKIAALETNKVAFPTPSSWSFECCHEKSNLFIWRSISFYIIDPQGRPPITASSDHCFHTYCPSVRPSVPTFQNLAKQNKISSGNNVHFWRDCGSGRVDHWWHDICLVYYYFLNLFLQGNLKDWRIAPLWTKPTNPSPFSATPAFWAWDWNKGSSWR